MSQFLRSELNDFSYNKIRNIFLNIDYKYHKYSRKKKKKKYEENHLNVYIYSALHSTFISPFAYAADRTCFFRTLGRVKKYYSRRYPATLMGSSVRSFMQTPTQFNIAVAYTEHSVQEVRYFTFFFFPIF